MVRLSKILIYPHECYCRGLGGTCVNVGCIPKKLMHQAAILGKSLKDARKFGWDFPDEVTHSWQKMKDAVQEHIGTLNWNHRVLLREKNVTYLNSYGTFVGTHKIKVFLSWMGTYGISDL